MIRFKKEYHGIMNGHGLAMTDELDDGSEKIVLMKECIYQKKPIPVMAIRVPVDFEVETMEGLMKGKKDDYLIQGVNGELYPCDQEIFKKTYELITSIPPDPGEINEDYIKHIEDIRKATESWRGLSFGKKADS